MQRFHLKPQVAAVALALGAVFSTGAQASYSGLFVFGDSLSDSGNNAAIGLFDPAQVITGNTYIPTNTYSTSTYSNGPVWNFYLAASLGVPLTPSFLGGTNFAAGGATTGTDGGFALPSPPFPPAFTYPYSLVTQSTLALAGAGGSLPSSALYIVAGGGNNARAAASAIAGGADAATTIAAAAAAYASDVDGIVNNLQAAGAKHIIVWNTPNIGLAPAVAAQGPVAAGGATFLSATMNASLALALADEGPDVKTFDFFGFLNMVAANPAAFGLANVTDACGAVAGADCNTYAFWDGIHPTAAAQMRIADAVHALAVPEPSTYALFALGLAGLVGVTRRRRSDAS